MKHALTLMQKLPGAVLQAPRTTGLPETRTSVQCSPGEGGSHGKLVLLDYSVYKHNHLNCPFHSGLRNVAADPHSYITHAPGPGPAYNTRAGYSFAAQSKPAFAMGTKLHHGGYLSSLQSVYTAAGSPESLF